MKFNLALFADKSDIWREMGSGFQGEKSGLSFNDVMLLGSVIGLVCMSFWMLARFMAKEDRKQGYRNPHQRRDAGVGKELDCPELPIAASHVFRFAGKHERGRHKQRQPKAQQGRGPVLHPHRARNPSKPSAIVGAFIR